MKKLLKKLLKINKIELSKNHYAMPVPDNVEIKNILYDWPSHQGPFEGAVDFAVPVGTDILAAQDGKVIEIVDHNDIHGPSDAYANYLNYITIAHSNGEYSQYGHIQKGSVLVKVGDKVTQGQVIAKTGLNGWMEEPFLEHLHFFVFIQKYGNSFKGLRIKFLKTPTSTTPQ